MKTARRQKIESAAMCFMVVYLLCVFLYLSPTITTVLAIITVCLPFALGIIVNFFAGLSGPESDLDDSKEKHEDAQDEESLPNVNDRLNNGWRRFYPRRYNAIWRKHKCRSENDK
jgi:hypothetical protein